MPAPDRLKPQWFNILLALSDGERHGQGIMAEVLRQTEGSMRLWPTSLYGSLKRLTELGLLEESIQEGAAGEGDRRRFYRITESGRTGGGPDPTASGGGLGKFGSGMAGHQGGSVGDAGRR